MHKRTIHHTCRAVAMAGVVATALLAAGCGRGGDATHETAITLTGRTVEMEIPVAGMHCSACAETIHDTLARMPGVTACAASFDDGKVICTVDEAVTRAMLVGKIEQLGYDADPVGGEQENSGAGEQEGAESTAGG